MSHSRSSIKKVKVVAEDAAARRASFYSVIIALAFGAAAFLGWKSWNGEDPPAVSKRNAADMELRWICELGHRDRKLGQAGVGRCRICGLDSFAVESYRCPQHGLVEVQGEFTAQADGSLIISSVRIDGGPWIADVEDLQCPHCGKHLRWQRADPMADILKDGADAK